jgi:ferritin-like metal-binding protein YciE
LHLLQCANDRQVLQQEPEANPMAMESMQDLYLHELKDIYNAEKQILQALPKMAKKAKHDELRRAFEEHQR